MNKKLVQLYKRLTIQSIYKMNEQPIILRNEKSGYYVNPEAVARRMIKVIALHDDIKQPEQITLQSTWNEIGLNDMTYVEVMVEIEREFEIELPDDDVERFRTVNDAVEYIARSFFAI